MNENKSESGLPFNLTTLMVLLTVVGSFVLVSKKLSSDRPNPPSADALFQSFGDQRVEARLWEDPLGWQTNQLQESGAGAFGLLRQQIQARLLDSGRPILLPVMVQGGVYSEDHESRIRSRFAVVSALEEGGYAQEDAEHIGALETPWPTTKDLASGWLTNGRSLRIEKGDSSQTTSVTNRLQGCGKLRVGFEWYRSREFRPGAATVPAQAREVLVLWLDENQFADIPYLRLALFLNELAATNSLSASTPGTPDSSAISDSPVDGSITNMVERIALVGPRMSATLRAMLPPYEKTDYLSAAAGPWLQTNIAKVLHHVDVFCPTPSAMDEVLVATSSNAPPRRPIEHALTNFWFRSFRSYCATDAQLADEALAELKLRNVDLESKQKNLVLISEWDTFYGRMLSLTYAAALAHVQKESPSNRDFVDRYRSEPAYEKSWPTNLHSFVYLRGLDGQSTRPSPREPAQPEGRQLQSLMDLKRGTLDQNKAEGEAQLDYLVRLGDRIKELEKKLNREKRGVVDAIGIVGSDVYDTLVILQALRPKFKNAVFFTTDLDARFLHPKEQEWSRNLIVISSYGLQLGEKLQRQVAPFRDSTQTAQFAATLAAFGDSSLPALTNLLALTNIPPRRFEVGRSLAYDLSVTEGGGLHPTPPAQRGWASSARKNAGAALILLCGGLLLSLVWRPLGRLTWDRKQFEIECLWFREEDVGGVDGFNHLRAALQTSRDQFAVWLWNSFCSYERDSSGLVPEEHIQRFLDFVNQRVLQINLPADLVATSGAITSQTKEGFLQIEREGQSGDVFLQANSLRRLRLHRQVLDELFRKLCKVTVPSGVDTVDQAAAHARQAGLQRYQLRCEQRHAIWLGIPAVVFMFLLVLGIALHDHFYKPNGEPLLFFAGISVWPTELLRLAAAVLAVVFVATAYASLRSGILDMTRRYRLPLMLEPCSSKWRLRSTSAPQATLDAVGLWEHYQQLGRFGQRLKRMTLPLLSYLFFAGGIGLLGQSPYRPVRGLVSSGWDLGLLIVAVLAFLFLGFWLIDAASLCRWLIEHFSEAPTKYPEPCLRLVAESRGLKGQELKNIRILEEWIDLQVIAELSERVGRLVYYPFIVFFVLLLSRNSWWDRWPWPPSLIIIFGLNLGLAAVSVVILQRAALKARDVGLESLRAKVEEAERQAAPTPEAHHAGIGRKLLEEMQTLKRGAFAPFWENPVIGAILVPSGGTVLLELMTYLFG